MAKSAELNHAELNHIVFYTLKVSETIQFWENILGLKNRGNKESPHYKIGEFTIMFLYSEKTFGDYSKFVGHFGFELSSQKEINDLYKGIQKRSQSNIKKPFGGGANGPYRFYITDPNQILLEFETWEGCDNQWKNRNFDSN